ncbi:hypothetical protein BCR32DRAFT_26408 [Anaeromyces robustus]|uniref:Periplasmic binding protein-like II n=1 Tax=Anaeromyces robustus TaxID=1754192 RepID=A0A1Y1X2Q7_9FUNG|nr:hypothetical protein BCR32DRAFT_26408 [Anaeromyces robustus]|eukprot:ORX80087.1 hypothetical protein BCR32DRAFT_26408 [Anaeromyces robustus]
MIIWNIFVIIQLLFFIGVIKALSLNALAFSKNGASELYLPLITQFNDYAKENGYNINLHLNLFSELNSTALVTDYESMIDSVFRRKSSKYDLVFFDNIYTARFGPHLLNILDKLPKEHIDLYRNGIASRSCVHNGEWVGLVCN